MAREQVRKGRAATEKSTSKSKTEQVKSVPEKVWLINSKDHPARTMLLAGLRNGLPDYPDITELHVIKWSPSKKFVKVQEIAPIQRLRWLNPAASSAPKCIEVLGKKEGKT